MCTHREREGEGGKRQMDRAEKVPFIWTRVKLRFNLMWPGWKTAGVSDNKCVPRTVCRCLIFRSQLHCSFSLFSNGNKTLKISLREPLRWKQAQRVVRSSLSRQCYCLVDAETNSSITPPGICPDMWRGVIGRGSLSLWGDAGGRASVMWISCWEGTNSTAHLLLFSNPTLSAILIKWSVLGDILLILVQYAQWGRSFCTTQSVGKKKKNPKPFQFQKCHINELSVIRANL